MPVPHLNVLPDSNILVSQTLHSWIGLIAAEKRSEWHFYYTEDILAEAIYHRRRLFPKVNSKQIEDMRDRLINTVVEFKQIKAFQYDNTVTYPDINDAHVHSAAIHGNIEIIISNNKKDFMTIYKNPDDCPYEVYTGDEFLMLVADTCPKSIDNVLIQQYKFYLRKGKSFSIPKKLENAACPEFADYIRGRLQTLQEQQRLPAKQ